MTCSNPRCRAGWIFDRHNRTSHRCMECEAAERAGVEGNGKPDAEACFLEFHEAHPEVYQELRRLSYQFRDACPGQQTGIRLFWERMRWTFRVERGDEEFKLNNNYTKFYSRLLMREPGLRGVFEVRG